jgi:3-hydroxyacyl-CoA dehydrogenase
MPSSAERAASKIPDVPEDTPKREIGAVGVIGAGTMGGGITMNFLNAGIPVKMLEMKQEALDKGVATIRKNYEAQVKKGKLKQDKYDQRMALLSTTLSYDDLKDADLVIEAVFEEIGVKEAGVQGARRGDEARRHPGQSNTSTLDVNKIASFTKRPQDVVGLHFFSPANVMKLLEVVRGEKTAKDVLATVMAVAKKIKKTAVVSGVCDGFIGNRMIEQYGRQAGFLLDEGCTPAAGGQGHGEVRHGDGPVPHGRPGRQRHRLGHPQAPLRREARHEVQQDRRPAVRAGPLRPEDRRGLVRLRCRQARRHSQCRSGQDDRGPPQGVAGHHAAQDQRRGDRAALVFALVNEAARILEEGIASKASDIDMVYLTGYGFPLHRGGPMNYADQVGLFNVVQAMNRFAKNPLDDARFWQPAPLLAKLAAEGKTFN